MTERVWTEQEVEDGHVSSLERAKFTRSSDSKVAVRTNLEGTIRPSGLTTGGKITVVSINDSGWTALPSSPLTDRNAITIQNLSGVDIKINYDNTVGYVGILVPDRGQRYYDITDSIILYARSSSGTIDLIVEEIA